MQSQTNIISNNRILWASPASTLEALKKLDNQHAPVMLSTFCNLAKVTTIAGEILKDSSSQSKDKQIISKASTFLYLPLLRHTPASMLQQVKEREIPSSKNPILKISLINIFFSEHLNINKLAFKLNLTVKETIKEIRNEFLKFQHKNISRVENYKHQVQIEEYALVNNWNCSKRDIIYLKMYDRK